MKRVKKGFWMELPRDAHIAVAVTVRECNDWLRLAQRVTRSDGSAHTDAVDLSPAQCEALGITAALEDVPEPWERVRDAVLAECVFTPTGGGHYDISVGEKAWRAIAKRLGIKPEGES